ncbi:MAG: aromatic-L-amino-acid/L-tryptophan decarboxylase [Actinomycetota bacterium]|jgi:hypothetical protein|nr:aromatic-L-amino-acid/L-tryptophan decarboxylase [Actinomycetota bacterium]
MSCTVRIAKSYAQAGVALPHSSLNRHPFAPHQRGTSAGLLGYTGDPEVASEAQAEAFAQLLRRGAEVRDPERWVWKAAFKIAAGELKAGRRATRRALPRTGWNAGDYDAWWRRLLEAQIGFVQPTKWESETVGRLCFINPRTTIDNVRAILGTMNQATATHR